MSVVIPGAPVVPLEPPVIPVVFPPDGPAVLLDALAGPLVPVAELPVTPVLDPLLLHEALAELDADPLVAPMPLPLPNGPVEPDVAVIPLLPLIPPTAPVLLLLR